MNHSEFRSALESRIDDWFEAQKTAAPTEQAIELISRIHNFIRRGGKRSRPELMYLTYSVYGGESPEKIIDLGAALELYHQFLLVHDDIMDKDTVRYGGPNVVGMYEKSGMNVAESMGILAGDLLFTYANQLIMGLEISASRKVELLGLLHAVNADEMFGQQLDVFNILENVDSFSKERLMLIHELKTARYTTQLPMSVISIVLELDEDERKNIEDFGRLFGVAYQLADDYSDYFENKSSFSAQKFRDYRSGKMTLPIYIALQKVDAYDRTKLLAGFGHKDSSDEQVMAALDIIESCGAKVASHQLAEGYLHSAQAALRSLGINEPGQKVLSSLLEKFRV